MNARVQADLDRVMRRGRRVFAPGVVVYFAPLSQPTKPRIVVSQKVDKRSVVRHKIKRQLRHILQGLHLGNLGVVVVTKKEILDRSFAELHKTMGSLLPNTHENHSPRSS
jgi:ribonuclease P protein component